MNLTMMRRCDPQERDCLYALLRSLSKDLADSKDLLAIYERLYSNDLSGSIPKHQDPRVSLEEQDLDISENLFD